ncbi:hypothetical protein [Streptomyces sp. AC627_RSS907]|uniref:hypothetical protein n=1 Tax=Streptomyces sp. AC627_RSS907 TaxID=2823684 RepID=UPI0020B7675B|nr:hypothetical protein [Streptomyces sp. AC627_RSS907]
MPLHAGEHRAATPPRPGPPRPESRGPEPHRGGRDRRRVRLYGLAGVLVCAVVLPFALASPRPPVAGGQGAPAARLAQDGAAGAFEGAGRTPAAAAPPPSRLSVGVATAVRCGSALTSPEGIEAQTCVLTQGAESWARTSYRNTTGRPLESVLSLVGPDGSGVRTRCAVGAGDAPDACETPRERHRGEPAAYTAVAEFASRAGHGPLLLRSRSEGADGSGGGDGSVEGGGADVRGGGGTGRNSPVETGS